MAWRRLSNSKEADRFQGRTADEINEGSKEENDQTVNMRAKKAPPVVNRKGFRKPKNQKTVFTKIKQALDQTAAKLKTILPGETKSNHRHASR
jgi:hypothetical protein